jgi:NADH:ubiquinone oxidoreductase subunit 2 (subunit N)
MAGFVALAMVCYQRVEKTRWWIAMGACLAAAVSSHYYAIFGSAQPF